MSNLILDRTEQDGLNTEQRSPSQGYLNPLVSNRAGSMNHIRWNPSRVYPPGCVA
jgi:hypothetical protein